MSASAMSAEAAVARLAEFDAVIDVRSPSEYAQDHLPGAVNWPVLDDAERTRVGTLYVQVSPLQARLVGAALVARNIARHLERELESRTGAMPRTWRPLVYCWRGGQRSGAMGWFLGQIGFRTTQLAGGYKAFRGVVRAALERPADTLELRVLCGRTGSGKTRLLHALREAGAQVVDLEALACHRGSVLGALPGQPQPSQKRFDTLLWQALGGLDPARPVFIESESAKIGRLRVPAALVERMRAATCLRVDMPDAARVALLLEDYAFLKDDVEAFSRQLDSLIALRGKETVQGWQAAARAGRFAEVFGDLMRQHYDPLYDRSMQRHFQALSQATPVMLADGGPASLAAAAGELTSSAHVQAAVAAEIGTGDEA